MFFKIKSYYYYLKNKLLIFFSKFSWKGMFFLLLFIIVLAYVFMLLFLSQPLTSFVDEYEYAKKIERVHELEDQIELLLTSMYVSKHHNPSYHINKIPIQLGYLPWFWASSLCFLPFVSSVESHILLVLYVIGSSFVAAHIAGPRRVVSVTALKQFSLFIWFLKAYWMGYIDLSEWEWISTQVFFYLDGKQLETFYHPVEVLNMIKNAFVEGRFGHINNYIRFLELFSKILWKFYFGYNKLYNFS